jgi:aryl-phospho-beta-D-glucosidase BglC (GH1 family)
MKKMLQALFVVLVASTPALAQKITIDYAHEFDFSSVETFQYIQTKESNVPDEFTDNRIRNAIIRELHEGGLMSASSDPDLYVTYHLTSKENTVFTTTGFGYDGFHGGWGAWGDGMGSATTTATTYTEGTLIIDAYGPDEKKMVWRGTGTVTVKSKPEKQQKQIVKILARLGKKWDKILAGEGK